MFPLDTAMDAYIATRQHIDHIRMQEIPTKAAIFYDGQCPMCSREIAHYRRLPGSEQLFWIDITEQENQLLAFGLTRETAMARFHVCDKQGRWHTGAWAFAELWSHLPYYRWLSYLVRRFRLLPLLDWAYIYFARWRLSNSMENSIFKRECRDVCEKCLNH